MIRHEAVLATILVAGLCGCSGSGATTNLDAACVFDNSSHTAVHLHQSDKALRITWTSMPLIPAGHTTNLVDVVLGRDTYLIDFMWHDNGQAYVALWTTSPPSQVQDLLESRSHFTGHRVTMTVPLAKMLQLGRGFAWRATVGPRVRPDFASCPSSGRTLRFPARA